jgi:hypothetical protein
MCAVKALQRIALAVSVHVAALAKRAKGRPVLSHRPAHRNPYHKASDVNRTITTLRIAFVTALLAAHAWLENASPEYDCDLVADCTQTQ